MNTAFLQKAEALKPELFHQKILPVNGTSVDAMNTGDRSVFDFGNHHVGYLTITLSAKGNHYDAPAWIRFQFAEQLCELDEDPAQYKGWISKSWIQQEQIHVDVLPCTITLPRRYAFRYVQIEVLAVSSYSLAVESISCDSVTSADDKALLPFSADAPLERIDAIACRTLRSCMQSVFEDGPKRDRRLWMGDLRLQALANYTTYRNFDLVKRCLYLFAGTTLPDGAVPSCLYLEPEVEGGNASLLDYALLYIPALLDYLEASSDMETVKELYPVAMRQLEISRTKFSSDGVIDDVPGITWCFIDWDLKLNKQTSAHGVFLYCLDAAIRLSEKLGIDAHELKNEFNEKRSAAKAAFWDKQLNLFCSGAEKQISWASQIWMILGGVLAPEESADLLQRLEGFPEAHQMVTPYLYHYYVEALFSIGQDQKAFQVIRSYWGAMANAGADTYWEFYDPKNPGFSPYGGTIVNSYCHAWSCAPAWFCRKKYSEGQAQLK